MVGMHRSIRVRPRLQGTTVATSSESASVALTPPSPLLEWSAPCHVPHHQGAPCAAAFVSLTAANIYHQDYLADSRAPPCVPIPYDDAFVTVAGVGCKCYALEL
ncbi:hypothetical protein ACP4OV_029413 [Aristida adscensionis]